MDSNLLKEAIADAKAVRATALANAKVALEEAFAPRFQAMFAEKLMKEAGVGVAPTAPVAEEATVNESDVEALIKELEDEANAEEAPALPPADVGAEAGAGAEEPPALPPAGGEGQPLKDGDVVRLKLEPVSAGAELPPTPPEGAEAGAEAGSELPPQGGEDDEVNLDELLESLKAEAMEEEKDEECIKESVPVGSSAIGGKVGGSDNKKPSTDASATSHIESAAKDKVGMPGAKKGPDDATNATRPNSKGDFANTPKLAKEAVETGVPGGTVTAKEPTDAKRPNEGPVTSTSMDTPALEENIKLKKQLSEATDTITFIKGQLNEINLLNAKLLYTNKLFKEFTMNNDQKMRVVEMFDLSKNVREVKLTYATIAESLNFGGDTKKKPVASASVQSITEGIASKPVGSTKPSKQIISESAMVSKFQKLAGIKKKI